MNPPDQRPFLEDPLPGLALPDGNGDACTAGAFAVVDFGFFFSRLLFWSPLATFVSCVFRDHAGRAGMACPPCRLPSRDHVVTQWKSAKT